MVYYIKKNRLLLILLLLQTTNLFYKVCNSMTTPKEKLKINIDDRNEFRNTGNTESTAQMFVKHEINVYDPRLVANVAECIAHVRKEYEEKFKHPQDIPQYTEKTTYPMAAGNNGIVLWEPLKSQTMVRKISKNAKFDLGDFAFIHEFCIAHITNSPYIAIVNNFSPLEVSSYENEKFRNTKYYVKHFDNRRSKKYVPSFESEICVEINWENLGKEFQGIEENVINSMIYALNHVHKSSGISILDVKEDNIMLCDGRFKFIDMGMAQFFNDRRDTTLMMFGAPAYRSPWAIVFEHLFHDDAISIGMINHYPDWFQELFFSEYEAVDFWSIGILCMREFCGLKSDVLNNIIDGFMKAVKEIPINANYEEDIYELWDTDYEGLLLDPLLDGPCSKNENIKLLMFQLLQINPKNRLEHVQNSLTNSELMKKKKKTKKIKLI